MQLIAAVHACWFLQASEQLGRQQSSQEANAKSTDLILKSVSKMPDAPPCKLLPVTAVQLFKKCLSNAADLLT